MCFSKWPVSILSVFISYTNYNYEINIRFFLFLKELPSLENQLQTLNILVLLLPSVNRHTVRQVLRLLANIIARNECNKMNLSNVATVIAPNLFPNILSLDSKQPNDLKSNQDQIVRALDSCKVTQLLINYQDILFLLPPHLSAQMKEIKLNT